MIKNDQILSLTIIIKNNKRTNYYRTIITKADNTPNNFILHFLTVLIILVIKYITYLTLLVL